MGLTWLTGYFLSLGGNHRLFPEFCLFLHPLAKWSELPHRKQWSQFTLLVSWHFVHSLLLRPTWSSLWLVSCSLALTCWFVRVSLSSASSACTLFMAVTNSPCLGTFFSFIDCSCSTGCSPSGVKDFTAWTLLTFLALPNFFCHSVSVDTIRFN